jgi:hypothetical protein
MQSCDYFIAIYTHQCKSYCHNKFYDNLKHLDYNDYSINIVDNTTVSDKYYAQLSSTFFDIDNLSFNIHKISIDQEPEEGRFHRSIVESVNFLRDRFLTTDAKYFVIIESDVIVPKNLLNLFDEVVDSEYSAIGGIYYNNYHQKEWFDSSHCELLDHSNGPTLLSGCTLYKRDVIERFSFRYEQSNLYAFPDTCICNDMMNAKMRLANYTKIKCQHLPGKLTFD